MRIGLGAVVTGIHEAVCQSLGDECPSMVGVFDEVQSQAAQAGPGWLSGGIR